MRHAFGKICGTIALSTVAFGNWSHAQSFKMAASEDPRFIRRLYIDLTGRIPNLTERSEFSKDDFDIFAQITKMLASPESASALSTLASDIWQIDERNFPDLERFIADGNSALASSLDATTRAAIAQEMRLHLREMILKNRSFASLYSSNTTYAPNTALTFWGLSTSSNVGSSTDPYSQSTYNDTRPSIGSASSNASLAALESHFDSTARIKSKNFLQKYACQEFNNVNAHQFTEVPSERLNSGLLTYANSTAKCAGCHASYENIRTIFSGVGRQTSFDTWKSDQVPRSNSGFYAGHLFDSMDQFSESFSNDPRLRQCFFQRMFAGIYQRKFDDSTDYETMLTMFGLLDLEDNNLQKALRLIFLSGNYRTIAMTSTTAPSLRLRISGFRFLGPSQFNAIAKELAGAGHQISTSSALFPRVQEDVENSRYIPGADYYSAVNDFVRKLSAKTVDVEFAATSKAGERKLFPKLPDGAATPLTDLEIESSIIHLWNYLIGETLASSDESILSLVSVFKEVLEIEVSSEKAWEAVLVGIMLDPKFISY